ncbi:something about silencing protein 10-like [Mya arenaria]|uniref:something about silencing protein 10-like n=1 Tax=Mya arenaria TaxID=6604 RepID=UPI0022E4DE3D|nr:something about silencing protein 10-like [Mya arenaria]
MPRKGKKKGVEKKSDGVVPEYASDDERLYGRLDKPDPESREYIYDDVDEFHASREKVLLEKGFKDEDMGPMSDEEGVMDLESEESDDEEIRELKAQLRRVKHLQHKADLGSDMEDESEEEDEEEGLPDNKAWGSRRSKYYGDDDIDLKGLEEDDGEAAMEEREALKLQRQMAAQLDEADLGLDLFTTSPGPQPTAKEVHGKGVKITKDLSKLSRKEKLKLLKKESPELLTLIDDFKTKMTELQERWLPLKDLIAGQKFEGKAADYVHTKFKLLINYCMNILFYLMLKAKQAPIHNHPVIKRLLQYRNIMQQLAPLDSQMEDEVNDIVGRLAAGEEVTLTPAPIQTPTGTIVRRKRSKASKGVEKKRKISELVSDSDGAESDDLYEDVGVQKTKIKKAVGDQYETKDERAALEYYQMMKAGRPDHEGQEEGEEEDVEGMLAGVGDEGEEEDGLDGKRAINYQIEKNKGLTAHKKKELRNPRVKHRMKFRKANIRRKGQFREPRTETYKYGGEISGIRAAVKRGIKLK